MLSCKRTVCTTHWLTYLKLSIAIIRYFHCAVSVPICYIIYKYIDIYLAINIFHSLQTRTEINSQQQLAQKDISINNTHTLTQNNKAQLAQAKERDDSKNGKMACRQQYPAKNNNIAHPLCCCVRSARKFM